MTESDNMIERGPIRQAGDDTPVMGYTIIGEAEGDEVVWYKNLFTERQFEERKVKHARLDAEFKEMLKPHREFMATISFEEMQDYKDEMRRSSTPSREGNNN